MKSPSASTRGFEVAPDVMAAMLHVTTRRVGQLADEGVAVRLGDGYDAVSTVRNYIDRLRADKKGKAGTYEAAKLKEKEAKARIAELEANEREGKLLELSTVQQVCGSICTAFTNRLANFGDGLASICHQQPGDFVAQRINEGLRSALRELSKMPYVPKGEE